MKFTETHEWVEVNGSLAKVGISNHAQKELGDVVYVELPAVGHRVKAGDEVVVIESTKAAVDIYSPISGEITAVNTSLRDAPEKINSAPESDGWLFQLRLSNPQELSPFMDPKSYLTFVN